MANGLSADLPKGTDQETTPLQNSNLPNRIGAGISEYFRSIHNSLSNRAIWSNADRPNWESCAFNIDSPKYGDTVVNWAKDTAGQTFKPTGHAEFITQPVGGDGSDWEYNTTDYSIPYADGNDHIRHGEVKNTRLVTEKGELTLITTSVNMRGGLQKIDSIKYSEADEQQRKKIDDILKHIWNNRLHPNGPAIE